MSILTWPCPNDKGQCLLPELGVVKVCVWSCDLSTTLAHLYICTWHGSEPLLVLGIAQDGVWGVGEVCAAM